MRLAISARLMSPEHRWSRARVIHHSSGSAEIGGVHFPSTSPPKQLGQARPHEVKGGFINHHQRRIRILANSSSPHLHYPKSLVDRFIGFVSESELRELKASDHSCASQFHCIPVERLHLGQAPNQPSGIRANSTWNRTTKLINDQGDLEVKASLLHGCQGEPGTCHRLRLPGSCRRNADCRFPAI